MILRASCRPFLGTFVSWLVHTINAELAEALSQSDFPEISGQKCLYFTLGRIRELRSARVPQTQFTPCSYVKRNRRVLCVETRR